VTQFVLDSLRYWVHEMGVDGFRFDLAPVLGRGGHGFDAHAPFFTALRQDPVLAGARLVAEPWDAGADGYQVGRFPGRFQEWNDKFRDAVRGYWLRQGVDRGEFARRFTASDDLFRHHQRKPTASVNFIAVHDGFTLADLVSYSRKHNDANGEGNRDGRDDELASNLGVEGRPRTAWSIALRRRMRRAMMATLLLAQGTPMLCAGDEIGNSQGGNNNAYCQDNPTGWLDWAQADPPSCSSPPKRARCAAAEPLLHHGRWFAQAGEPGTGPACPGACRRRRAERAGLARRRRARARLPDRFRLRPAGRRQREAAAAVQSGSAGSRLRAARGRVDARARPQWRARAPPGTLPRALAVPAAQRWSCCVRPPTNNTETPGHEPRPAPHGCAAAHHSHFPRLARHRRLRPGRASASWTGWRSGQSLWPVVA
jgi:hypothetical protein